MAALLSARDLRAALLDSLDALRRASGAIDAANVYPVPDADTGTNLVMTFEAIARSIASAGGSDTEVAGAIADGALHGARGNSGIILAQVVRSWAEGVARGAVGPDELGRIFVQASERAWESILAPATGTILSVLDAARDAVLADHPDVRAALEAAALAARRALEETPKQLAVLARAGVVDAGGMGLVVVLDALARAAGADLTPYTAPVARSDAIDCVRDEGPPTFRYEVQYMLESDGAAIPALRELLGTIGDSVVVIGGDDQWRVHVHTDQPERARALGEAIGTVSEHELVDFEQRLSEHAEGARGIPIARDEATARLIAAADGEGARRLFSSLGAHVIAGGADLDAVMAALEETGRPAIVLPNDEELFARIAPTLDEVPNVLVLRTSDMAQGVAVALAYADGVAFERLAREMTETFARVRSGQVVVSPSTLDTAIGTAEAGSAVAIVEGSVVAIEADPVDAAVGVARALLDGGDTVLTVLCGADVDDAERTRLRDVLDAAFPRYQIDVHDAGQARHRYLLSSD